MADLILLQTILETSIELWRPIEGWLGYEVSNMGRFRSFRVTRRKVGKNGFVSEIASEPHVLLLRPQRGYLYVRLSANNRSRLLIAHRLVAKAFIPNPLNLPEVNHRSFLKTDIRAGNLEWVTKLQNMHHAERSGRIPHGKGSAHHRSKLTEDQVLEIRRLRADGLTQKVIAERFGVDETLIGHIEKRRIWTHI